MDPRKLTKKQLADELALTGVYIPLSEKKNVFIEAYETKGKVRDARPSSHGIEFMEEDSEFSQENPFQSSPPSAAKKTAIKPTTPLKKAAREASPIRSPTRSKKKSLLSGDESDASSKRLTKRKEKETVITPLPQLQTSPIPRLQNSPVSYQSPMIHEQPPIGQVPLNRPRNNFGFIVVGIIAFIFAYYISLPFCSKGSASVKLSSLDEFISSLRNYCLQCPLNADCVDGELHCNPGFMRSMNWNMRPICIRDERRMKRVTLAVHQTKEYLAKQAGLAECGKIESGLVSQRHLTEIVPIELFEDVISRLKNSKDIKTIIKDQTYFLSNSPSLSFICLLNLYTNWIISTLKIPLMLLAFGLLIFMLHRHQANKRKAIQTQVQIMLAQVYEKLVDQESKHLQNPSIGASVSVNQLRDHLNADSTLWDAVCLAVKRNSNVRESISSIKGEQHRVWQWIGSEALTPRRKVESVQ